MGPQCTWRAGRGMFACGPGRRRSGAKSRVVAQRRRQVSFGRSGVCRGHHRPDVDVIMANTKTGHWAQAQ